MLNKCGLVHHGTYVLLGSSAIAASLQSLSRIRILIFDVHITCSPFWRVETAIKANAGNGSPPHRHQSTCQSPVMVSTLALLCVEFFQPRNKRRKFAGGGTITVAIPYILSSTGVVVWMYPHVCTSWLVDPSRGPYKRKKQYSQGLG